jgi:threonyl-tRNA synthetase
MFKADEYDKEDFEWKEHALKPGFARPVMVHRAILGSVERFMAILCEHLAGKWPFFLSPRQVMIIPIAEKYIDYCDSVYLYLHRLGYQVEVDHSKMTLNKKVRTHQLAQFNFILVAGEDEAKNGTVDIRTRENVRIGKMRIDELHDYFQHLMPAKAN